MSTIYEREGQTAAAADVLRYIQEVERIRDGSSEAAKERRTYVNAHIRRTDRPTRTTAPAATTDDTNDTFVITPDGHIIDRGVPIVSDPPYVDDEPLSADCYIDDDGYIMDVGRVVTETATTAAASTYTNKSLYFIVQVSFKTVDEANAYRRDHDMLDVDIEQTELTYNQARARGLIK